MSGTNLCHSNV